jgi:hypothetical protein
MVIQVPLLLDQQEVLCGIIIIIITTATCGLFNDDVSISEYIAFNYRIVYIVYTHSIKWILGK